MVIVITGPIASGKSTIARKVAVELGRGRMRAAVIDLDLLEGMLRTDGRASDDSTWAIARHAAAMLTNAFLERGVAVVIAEGSFNTPSDRAGFARSLRNGIRPRYVTLRVSFEEALRRARADQSRGLSRDNDFLRSYFAEADHGLAAAPETDLVIDTERVTATAAAEAIARLVTQAP